MANMGAPPMVNLLGELISRIGGIIRRVTHFYQIRALIFLAGAYTLVLYRGTQQGQKKILYLVNLGVFLKDNLIFFTKRVFLVISCFRLKLI